MMFNIRKNIQYLIFLLLSRTLIRFIYILQQRPNVYLFIYSLKTLLVEVIETIAC